MRAENMALMDADELDDYARILGFSAKAARTPEEKAALIERKRGRTAVVEALGIEFEIQVKRARDKRVADAVAAGDDESCVLALSILLGDEQYAELLDACTDEDGTVDVDALGLAYARIVTSEELKNF